MHEQVQGAAAPVRMALAKAPTGISGLDEVLEGGLPRGRPTIVTGRAGCGKTLLSMEFLVNGARDFGEPGVFVSFEETAAELVANMQSLGFAVPELEAAGKLVLEHVHVERSEIEETGEYDLEALFIRLAYAIDSIGARRIVLDTIESLFAGLPNHNILRAELRRLFRWLKQRGMTAIVTAERGDGTLTRHGLEEYVSDCVILLDHRVENQITTRRLRVVKYRGSNHGSNEYPFLIGADGISLLPITSLGLDHVASTDHISTGVAQLDAMLGGAGIYRGSTVLISGTAGAGKTSLAAHLAEATAQRGERCLYVALEESPRQIVRNMRSIGIDFAPYIDQGLVRFYAERSTVYGLEMHLVMLHKLVQEFDPQVVIIDPITELAAIGDPLEVKAALMRMIDYLKLRGITAIFTSLTDAESAVEQSEIGISSLMDVWILLKMVESNGERNRVLYVLKARGLDHSNQLREFLLTGSGVQLADVYLGAEGVLTGTARTAQEARDRATALTRELALLRRQRELERKREAIRANIRALRGEYAAAEEEMQALQAEAQQAAAVEHDALARIAARRGAQAQGASADSPAPSPAANGSTQGGDQ